MHVVIVDFLLKLTLSISCRTARVLHKFLSSVTIAPAIMVLVLTSGSPGCTFRRLLGSPLKVPHRRINQPSTLCRFIDSVAVAILRIGEHNLIVAFIKKNIFNIQNIALGNGDTQANVVAGINSRSRPTFLMTLSKHPVLVSHLIFHVRA